MKKIISIIIMLTLAFSNVPQIKIIQAYANESDNSNRVIVLENIESKLVFSNDGECIWICRNCGHIVIGKEAPLVCPVCNHPQSFFERKANNY